MSLRLCSNDERNLTNRVTLGCSFPSAVCLDCAPWRTWRRMGWAEEFFKVYHYTYSTGIMVSTGMRESISHVVRQPRPCDKLCAAPSSVPPKIHTEGWRDRPDIMPVPRRYVQGLACPENNLGERQARSICVRPFSLRQLWAFQINRACVHQVAFAWVELLGEVWRVEPHVFFSHNLHRRGAIPSHLR